MARTAEQVRRIALMWTSDFCCISWFERVRDSWRKILRPAREGSRGFERFREGSRGFEILRPAREGSRGFERVRETHLKPAREGSRGFERVRAGSRRASQTLNWLQRHRQSRRQMSVPAARVWGGRSRVRVLQHYTDLDFESFPLHPICHRIVSKIFLGQAARAQHIFLIWAHWEISTIQIKCFWNCNCKCRSTEALKFTWISEPIKSHNCVWEGRWDSWPGWSPNVEKVLAVLVQKQQKRKTNFKCHEDMDDHMGSITITFGIKFWWIGL